MYLLSCYNHYIQVVLIIVSALVYSSHTVPLNPSAESRSLDIDQLIDPLNPQNHHDLETKKVLPKSILFTPLRTAAPPINHCPPGHLSREDGTCIKTITGITLNEETLVAVLDNFYKSKRKPSNRHRHRTTTTTTPRQKEFVPTTTTTEVITESTFESTTTTTATTLQPSLLIHQVVTSEINPTIYPETNPEVETTTIVSTSTSVNEPRGHEISNQPTPLHVQQQIYELVPTVTSIPTEMYMTEASIPLELTTFQPSPDQLFSITSPTDNPLNNITVLSSSDVITVINPDGNDDDKEATSTNKPFSPSPPPSLHEMQQMNDELVPTTTTQDPTPQEYSITETNVFSEFETTVPSSSFEPLQILNITFPNPKILPNDNLTTTKRTFTDESRKEDTEVHTRIHQDPFPSISSFLFLHQDKFERLEKGNNKQLDEDIKETFLPSHQQEQEKNEKTVMPVEILHEDKKVQEEQRQKLQVHSTLPTSLLSSSFHDKDELHIIVPVSSTQESIIDSKSNSKSSSSSDTVIKEPL